MRSFRARVWLTGWRVLVTVAVFVGVGVVVALALVGRY